MVIDQAGLALPDALRGALAGDGRRLIVVGARGWIGRSLLALIDDALDDAALTDRLALFGSGAGRITLPSGRVVDQAPLHQALATLDERKQKILRRRFFEGFSQQEVADELGLSQMHISRLERSALQQLRQCMAGLQA